MSDVHFDLGLGSRSLSAYVTFQKKTIFRSVICQVVWNIKYIYLNQTFLFSDLHFDFDLGSRSLSAYSPSAKRRHRSSIFIFGLISKIFHRFTLLVMNLIKFNFGWNRPNVKVTIDNYFNKFRCLSKWRRHRSSIFVFFSNFKNISQIYFIGDELDQVQLWVKSGQCQGHNSQLPL